MKQFNALHLKKLFDRDEFHPPVWRPSLDVYRTRGGWLLKFELAGVLFDDVRLEVTDRIVRLTGTRRDLICRDDCVHHGMEIAYSSFERSLELPVSLANAKIDSRISDGMLLVQIELP